MNFPDQGRCAGVVLRSDDRHLNRLCHGEVQCAEKMPESPWVSGHRLGEAGQKIPCDGGVGVIARKRS